MITVLVFLLCIILLPYALGAAVRLWFIFLPILAILALVSASAPTSSLASHCTE
jgi:hypothetical protein